MKKLLILFLFALCAGRASAQTGREVSGIVTDSTGTEVAGATVKLFPITGKGDTVMVRSNNSGVFVMKGVKISQFNLSVSSLGFNTFNGKFQYANGTSRIILDKIILKQSTNLLKEVTINGPTITIKEDTVEYRAADYNLKEGAVVEDLVKKLEGAELASDGTLTYNGKAVTRAKVNGKEYAGGDLQTALKNIPVDAVDKAQFVDDYGENAAFTGVKEGDPETILNLVFKPGRNKGVLANSTLAGGNENRYKFSGFGNKMRDERSVVISGGINNDGSTLAGSGFGGAGGLAGAGGGRGAPGGGGNQGASFSSGGGNGITTQGNVTFGYNDRLSKKVTITTAGTFTHRNTQSITNTYREQANVLGTSFTNSNSNSDNITNSVGLRIGQLVYQINKTNQLRVSNVSASYSDADNSSSRANFQTGVIKQDQLTKSSSGSTTPTVSGNVDYNHLFTKKGRNTSLSFQMNGNDGKSDNLSDNHILYYDAANVTKLLKDSVNYRVNNNTNPSTNVGATFTFNEPLTVTTRLTFTYNYSRTSYDTHRIVNFLNSAGLLTQIDSLSNIFNYSSTQQRIGLNYNYRNPKHQLTIGFQAYPTLLSGKSVSLKTTINRSQFYLIPAFRYVYTFSRTRNLQFQYNGRAQEPSFDQLQPVRNEINPQNPIVGNPDLNNSFTHNLTASYRSANNAKHTQFGLSLTGGLVRDQIVTNSVLVPDIYKSFKRESHYLNTNGTYNYSGNYNFSKSFNDRHYMMSFNGSAGLNNRISFADNIKNTAQQWNFRQRLGLNINPGNWMELSPNINYQYSIANYTLPTSTDTRLQNYSFGLTGSLYFLQDAKNPRIQRLVLGFDGSKNFIKGYGAANNTNPLLLNAYSEYRFMKNNSARLRLTANDVLNQTNNVTRTLTDNGFSETTTNRLTSYYMLSFQVAVNTLGAALRGGPRGQGQRPGGQNGAGGGPRGTGGGFGGGGGGGGGRGGR